MSDIDAINKQLEQIDEKLDTLPADAYNERITLRQRREDLKAEAAQLADHSEKLMPTDQLEAERSALLQQLDAIGSEQIDVVEQSGGGAEGLGATSLNRQVDSAHGGDEIRARIAKIDEILRERGIDPDANQT
jgi:small-conductance mechanosensitive channel